MKNITALIIMIAVAIAAVYGQTANNSISYPTTFDVGINLGYNPPYYTDNKLATLAVGDAQQGIRGYAINSLRVGLYDYFTDYFGYDARVDYFKYYRSIGARNIVAILGFPSDNHRNPQQYCSNGSAGTFRNLHSEIWIDTTNKIVNPDNTYAVYVYNIATRYAGLIKYYQVHNEPDAGDSWNSQSLPGEPGNWWENTPSPCEFAIKAPIYDYIRMVRITYEVVKAIDPNAYVSIGGIGSASYLDVILRNTDNPNNGQVDADHPYYGGAYFDCVDFHYYPHFTLRSWDNSINGFKYMRNSDNAVAKYLAFYDALKDVAIARGYDGSHFARKIFMCSETNIPREKFGDYIGSDVAQTNYAIKMLATSWANGLSQVDLYSMCDEAANPHVNEFQAMGLFDNLNSIIPYDNVPHREAIGVASFSSILDGTKYVFDSVRTAQININPKAVALAFINRYDDGDIAYVCWAKCDQDDNETSPTQSIVLPHGSLTIKSWDYYTTHDSVVTMSNTVAVDGTPVIIKPTGSTTNTNIYSTGRVEIRRNITHDWFYVECGLNCVQSIKLYDVNANCIAVFNTQKCDISTLPQSTYIASCHLCDGSIAYGRVVKY